MTYLGPLKVIFGVKDMAVKFPARIYVFGRRAVDHPRMRELMK